MAKLEQRGETWQVTILEFVNFKEDRTKEEESFFIEIKQVDDTTVWSKKSFLFYEIIEMDFL